ncbi:MAG: SRPBCC family protein [Flavisolibacter sp.]
MNNTNVKAEPGKHEIIITHMFDAPRDLVFKLYIDPESIPQWWGPRRLTTKVDRMEVRTGGRWRFIQHDPEGKEFAFHGVYHEIKRPERVVSTFEWEGMPGHVLMETIVFDDVEGKTKVTDSSVFQSVEDRDSMVKTGTEEGSYESGERFAEILIRMRERVRK